MWTEQDNQLCRTFMFKDFAQAMAFMTQVAIYAEKNNHHPWWSNVYNKVEVKLTTHDAGDQITEKDRSLAEVMNLAYDQYESE